MEVAGLLIGIPGLVKLLLEVTLDGYKTFSSVQSCGKDIGSCMLLLDVERERLEDWIRQLSTRGGDLSRLIDPTTKRYRVVLEVLAQMAGLFARVEELESKYGIRRVELGSGNEVDSKRQAITEGDSLPAKTRKRDMWRQRLKALRPGSQGAVLNTGNSDLMLKEATPHKHKLVTSSIPILISNGSTELAQYTIDTDLEVSVPRMLEVVKGIEKQAGVFHETLSSYSRFEWAFSTKEELGSLIRDLKGYNSALIKLTAPFVSQGKIIPGSQVPSSIRCNSATW
jgi:hypothetical protein